MVRILATLIVAVLAAMNAMAAPQLAKRDLTSPVTQVFGYTDGRTVYTACPVSAHVSKTYTSNNRGACSKNKSDCGREVYAYLGSGSRHTEGATYVIDICPPGTPKAETLGLTYTSYKQLGGTLKAGSLTNVNYKFLS